LLGVQHFILAVKSRAENLKNSTQIL